MKGGSGRAGTRGVPGTRGCLGSSEEPGGGSAALLLQAAPQGSRPHWQEGRLPIASLRKQSSEIAALALKKQPNLSFPTEQERYSADATCNEGTGAVLTPAQLSLHLGALRCGFHIHALSALHSPWLAFGRAGGKPPAPQQALARTGPGRKWFSSSSPSLQQKSHPFGVLPLPSLRSSLTCPGASRAFPAGNAERPIKQPRIKTSFSATPRRGPDFP